ncbi:MAG: ScyD/ScyE family protein [Solirubrobacterales bacterium]|nr:ScyD/ScyE family protein [Solirubrobacterales bacterium]
MGTLTPFPIQVGAAQVFKVDPDTGQFRVFADGLTTVLGLAFGQDGALYVLETSVGPGFPAPMRGQIVRIKGSHRTTIATGLDLPTALTVGPDGNLYVSANGFGAPPGVGEVLKITP